jgi:hypothetical protein
VVLTASSYNDQLMAGNVTITNALGAAPKAVTGVGCQADQLNIVTGFWNSTAAITSIQFKSTSGSATFTNALGSISLYGIPA